MEPERHGIQILESRSMLSAVSGYPYLKLFLVSFILMVVNEIIDLTEQEKSVLLAIRRASENNACQFRVSFFWGYLIFYHETVLNTLEVTILILIKINMNLNVLKKHFNFVS